MDPAGTVDSFFSSSLSSSPTPNPLPSTHSFIQSSSVAGMAGQEMTLAELASQFQYLMAATAQMQQLLACLMPREGSDDHPVEPTLRVGVPVDAPAQATQSELASASTAGPALSFSTPSHVVKLKVATPDTFNGDDLARSEEFINSLYLYFYGKKGLTDEEKITFALSYMKGGRAGRWSRRKVVEYSRAKKGPSWDDFLSDFREMFCDPDPAQTARYKMSHLEQGTRSAEDYVADFKELMDDTGFNDEALAYMFEMGLSKQLVKKITLTLSAAPKSLKEWMTIAVGLDRFHRRMEGTHGFFASSHSTESATSHQSNPPSSEQTPRQSVSPVKPPPSASFCSDVVPKEVDTNRKKVMARVCFRCLQPGHIRKDCQSKLDVNTIKLHDEIRAHILQEEEEKSKKAKETKETQDSPIMSLHGSSSGPSPTSFTSDFALPERVYIRSARLKVSTHIQVQVRALDTGSQHDLQALLDSGATGLFLSTSFVERNNLNTRKLPRAIPVYNADGTLNQGGSIKEEVDVVMTYQDHTEKATFAICDLGDKDAIIGHTWLFSHNPEIDWQSGKIELSRCPPKCRVEVNRSKGEQHHNDGKKRAAGRVLPLPVLQEEVDEPQAETSEIGSMLAEGDRLFVCTLKSPSYYINATQTISQKLAEQSSKAKPDWLKRTFEEIVPPQYHQYKAVFSKESFDELPDRKPWDHAIELKPGSEPHRCKIYPLSPNEQAELDAFLDENLKSGRIKPSKSPMASPVFFVKKKDGSLRLVQDYRKLNDMTIKNSYPLPLISDLVNKLSKAKYFTKLDVRWGYNNVRMKEGDEWKAAFRTNRGLFEPLVMFFGLTNSPATFQTMMNDLFKEVIDEGCVVIYMDDILVFTESLEEHHRIVKRVLEVLAKNKLYLKAEKCSFEQTQVEYLGLIISAGKIEMDPVKVEGVSTWPTPSNVKEVQSFLGFVNFYRRFIKDFSDIAKPLHDLTRKDSAWAWNDACQNAFDSLKNAITSSPILVFPDDNKPYKLEADSSDFATGAVLSQEGEDGKWHPVAFLSKSLSSVERNYDIHDKEMLAIIRALEEWRHYLEGTKHKFEIWTDHKNLEYFMTAKKLNRRQARWSLYLSRFDFSLHHRPGKSSGKPDALSRRPDHGKGEDDNRDVVLLKPEYFKIQALKQGHVLLSAQEKPLLQKIRESKDLDESVVKAVEELRKSGTSRIDGAEWVEEQGLILFRGKVYVPKDPELRRAIVQAHHDSQITGHPGRWKTLELVTRNYWWPGISRYVASYVQGCDRCSRTKTFPAMPSGTLIPTQIPKQVWQIITVDLITGLPESQGYDSIMVTVDRLSKMVHLIPTTARLSSEGLARLFRDNVWKHHGLPEQIISDRGPQFVSGFMRELNKLLGIKTSPSTAYHPQTDGQTERVNQEVEQYLRLFVNHRQDDWAEWLSLAEFSYNNRVQASTRQSPFMLNSGRHPRLGVEPLRDVEHASVEDFVQKMQSARNEAEAALHQAAQDMARYYDQQRGVAVSYKVGDQVWLDAKDIRTDRPSKKLSDKRFGPFKVLKVVSPNAYQLDLPPSMKLHPVFHTVKLRPYYPDSIPGRLPPQRLPPVVDGDQPEWEVEYIKDSRLKGRNSLQYLVKWKGYPHEESTWEPAANLENAADAIREFHRKHPSAPKRISALTFSSLKFRPYENFTEVPQSQLDSLHDWTQGKKLIEDNEA